MNSGPLVVEIVQFFPTEQCIADPSLFQAVRDIVAHDRKDKGLTAQYWGPSVERPNEYLWILLWQSRAHATAFEEDPSYPAFARQLQALATAPARSVFVRMTGNPLRSLGAPVTEVIMYTVPAAEDAVTMHDAIRRITYRLESLVSRGFVALSWGVADEDGSRGAYLSSWRSIEDHQRVGTVDEPVVFFKDIEPILQKLVEMYVSHVHLKLHETN